MNNTILGELPTTIAKKPWTAPVIAVIELNSAQNGTNPNNDAGSSLRKS